MKKKQLCGGPPCKERKFYNKGSLTLSRPRTAGGPCRPKILEIRPAPSSAYSKLQEVFRLIIFLSAIFACNLLCCGGGVMAEIHVLIILFFVAVESATLIPPQTDVLLVALFATNQYRAWLLLITAVAGSVLGGLVNYYIGRYIQIFEKKKWFPVKQEYLEKAESILQRHGKISLLLCGMPLIGDAVAITAGMSRVSPALFSGAAAISRTIRYAALWGMCEGLF